MNKWDKFWINKIFWLTGIIFIFVIISFYNIMLFNKSYMAEEKSELNVFQRQIEWAVKPYLAQKDYASIRKYCSDFINEDVKFRVFDRNNQLIAASADDAGPIKKDSDALKSQKNFWEIYKTVIKDKMISKIKEISIGDDTYYLELTISEEDVMKSIIRAERTIWYFFAACLILLISAFIYVIQKLRVPFNELQNSLKLIADGNLDTKIEVPAIDILQELACSIKKMTQRLKNQIIRLKQLEEYKSEFIQNISHEIKTPVTAINTAAELIENNNTLSSEQDKECFNIISYQVKQINNLVNDILKISEIESAKTNQTKQFKPINLNEIIEETINYTAPNDIKINFLFDGAICYLGDTALLSQAVSNLLTNAIKYSNSKTIDIELKHDTEFVYISVKDYGIGIAADQQEKIFEKFYRIDKARSRKSGGTGLGLSIVKNITELHGGTIELESEPDNGCKFTIKLPVKNQ